ncbi:ribosylnicotinamide kinase NDAI_0F02890 [Naumovozyma dairenensis CBS 421]|uniref:Phosphoribulokinase/uridine kinase domain-containing protein n=1 Tax=Naumovozyma dairenensis (strain ATCC 10597 / BCRC 20456 / CBS 421 / NBRC 0211 / NRRL Y-12639) TaxID=1071378 RepID=G0WCU6_NAUDC|nr:hypothetical protein NDAI_0F02890 [Naumovozyma dairenensis CBS 421]CCD25607.1 hypothetical protein NDAI_0F02890 [Naumovozyma dairenensis CBS 421]
MSTPSQNTTHNKRKIILVAISGCSSSGKTTIAKLTSQIFPEATLIHQDDFYKHDSEIPIDPIRKIQNWDCPEALDFSLFAKELDSIKRTGVVSNKLIHNDNVDDLTKFNSILKGQALTELKQKYAKINEAEYKIIIVDGFMILNNSEIRSKFNLNLLIRAPYCILKKRRNNRDGYKTLDSFWVDPPYYFDEFVYKSYKENHSFLFENNDVEDKLLHNGNKNDKILDFMNDDHVSIVTALNWVADGILSLCDVELEEQN